MPIYTVQQTTPNKKARGQLAHALKNTGAPNIQDLGDEGFRCTIDNPALQKKFVKFMAEFNAAISPLVVYLSHGTGLGEPLDLSAVDTAPPPENAPVQGSVPMGAPAPTAPAQGIGVGVTPLLGNGPAAPPPPAAPVVPIGGHAPDASSDNPHIDPAVLRQISTPKPAKVRMLCVAPSPLPFREMYDVDPIRKAVQKLDIRAVEKQRAHIKIGPMQDRGYRISVDRAMPIERRWVLFRVAPDGVLTRIAEGDVPLAVALCIIPFEAADPTPGVWLEKLQPHYRGEITAIEVVS